MQNEITQSTQLLDKRGNLATAGYATHMNFVYNKKDVKRQNRLKEWDFYQIHFDDRYVLQLTFGHVSYAMQIAVTLLDLQTGDKRTSGKMTLASQEVKDNMPTNPEVEHTLKYYSDDMHVLFDVTDKYRRLAFTQTDALGVKAEVNLFLTNVSKTKEKMVIATPFFKKGQFYLNYKENCFVVNGHCRIDDMCYRINNGFGLLDWGRGVWPYHHSWIWGNGGTLVNGKHFGFNIGWGFGNTEQATENMFFYNNKAYKLGTVTETKVGDNYRYQDDAGRFVFDVEFVHDHFTKTKLLWVNNQCHQLYGKWSGYVILDDGTKLDVPPFIAFCEHADNNW
ncbi:MAG: DUF2804 domain-containing protein [Clostridiales bacterium]|nr:DUF2804 domain-containing protein [Clostridiales bacterium]